MKITFTRRLLSIIVLGICTGSSAFGQAVNTDSLKLKYPVQDSYVTPFFGKSGLFLEHPQAIKKTVEYDPKTRKEKVSRKALLPRPPRDENAPREDRGPRPERRDDRGSRDGYRDNRGPRNDNRDSRPPREDRPEEPKQE